MGWRGKDLEDVCGGEISKEKNLDKYEKKVKQVGGKKIKNKCVRAFTMDIIYVICW